MAYVAQVSEKRSLHRGGKKTQLSDKGFFEWIDINWLTINDLIAAGHLSPPAWSPSVAIPYGVCFCLLNEIYKKTILDDHCTCSFARPTEVVSQFLDDIFQAIVIYIS